MNKIDKALLKLNKNEGEIFVNILKKLKKRQNVFRIRKGKIRVIFIIKDKKIKILSFERRNNRTYN